ncbi:MAG: SDR family NAD(P)-dependent oxidoreductase [Hyphomonadaceae bacterium]
MTGRAELRFDDRCVVISGAGRGIGRAHALELARRGAGVVVNDISPAPANEVVHEIKAAGGRAIAVAGDVADAETCRMLVARACEAFRSVDAVIANASINGRGKSFVDLAPSDVRAMLDVNVFGTWSLLQAAWPQLTIRGRGRVLLTTSQAALYGMANLSEYALAKAAMLGLMRTLAHEGAPSGVKVNALAPAAATRMTEQTIGDERALALLRMVQPPELVAPAAALLVHDACPASGEIFVAGGGHVGRVFIGETQGVTMPGAAFTSETLQAQWRSVCDDAGYRVPRNILETGDLQQKAEIARQLRELGFGF